jgi:hypothetical protein
VERSASLGWFKLPSIHSPFRWGMIDKDVYSHYDNPLNADLHEVLPGKLILFRGPRDLSGAEHRDKLAADASFLHRDFSPDYYARLFEGLNVSAVVRLNSVHYDARAFTDRGIQHVDLDCGSSPTPPPCAIAAFFRIVDAAPGAVAVHGRGGHGRAATLAALYLMRSHGFRAREATAWLRLMRLGSVLGEQQRYLAEIERSVSAVAALAALMSPIAI